MSILEEKTNEELQGMLDEARLIQQKVETQMRLNRNQVKEEEIKALVGRTAVFNIPYGHHVNDDEEMSTYLIGRVRAYKDGQIHFEDSVYIRKYYSKGDEDYDKFERMTADAIQRGSRIDPSRYNFWSETYEESTRVVAARMMLLHHIDWRVREEFAEELKQFINKRK